MPWQPVIDGDVIPARPIDRIAAGAGAHIDLMLGSTTDEWRFFLVPGGAIDHISPEILAGTVAAYGLPVDATLAAYRAGYPSASIGELFAALLGDWYVRIPVFRLADAHATSLAATYMYEFAWRSPLFRGKLGACHALEIGFAFDTLDTSGAEKLTGPNPPQALATAMHKAWVAFAVTGNPGWDEYDAGSRKVMRFDERSGVVVNPASEERELWEGIR